MPQRSLSASQILTVALAIVDELGLEKLTIRRLAQKLEVTPMAIYSYFKTKSAIVDNLLNHVLGEYQVTEHKAKRWQDWVAKVFERMRQALLAHPGVLPLLGTKSGMGKHAFEVTEEILAVLCKAGIPPAEAVRGFYSLISYTVGLVSIENGARSQECKSEQEDSEKWLKEARARFETLPKTKFPHLVALAPHLAKFTTDIQFQYGVYLIIQGLDKKASK